MSRAGCRVLVAMGLLVVVGCGGGAPFGVVRLGALNLEGTVDGDYLAGQLQQIEPQFQACYARTLRRSRTAEGQVGWRIKGGGGRLHPEVTANDTGNDDLVACATGAVAGLKLVEPEGSKPWEFTLDWSVKFAIARRP